MTENGNGKHIQETPPEGSGETLTVLDENYHRVESDLRMVSRAVRNRWPVPLSTVKEVLKRLDEIIAKRSVEVMSKEGPISLDGPADANAVKAAAVLRAMVADNQADEHIVFRAVQPKDKPDVQVNVQNNGSMALKIIEGIPEDAV